MVEVQVLEAKVKVQVLEMVEMKCAQCFLYVLPQVHLSKLKACKMIWDMVEMKLNPVPCFLALFIFCMP